MKKLALFCIILCAFPSAVNAQIYNPTQSSYRPVFSTLPPWEVSLGLTGVFSPIKETDGERLLGQQGGGSLRALYYLKPWLGMGIEGTWFFPSSANPVVDKYKVRRGGVVGKLVVGREVPVRPYGVVATGISRREVEYSFNWAQHYSANYVAFGLGVEIDMSATSFVGAEVRGIYNTSTEIGRFVRLESRREIEASLCLGLRF